MNTEIVVALATLGGVLIGAISTSILEYTRHSRQLLWDHYQDHIETYSGFLASADAWQYEMIWAAKEHHQNNRVGSIAHHPRVMDAHIRVLDYSHKLRIIANPEVRNAAETILNGCWKRQRLINRVNPELEPEPHKEASEIWGDNREEFLKAIKGQLPKSKFKVFNQIDQRMMKFDFRSGFQQITWQHPQDPTRQYEDRP